MRIAVDKTSINAIKPNNEYVYLYDNESYDELIKLNLHCIYWKYCDFVDINLTRYNVPCYKKAKATDNDYDKLPKKNNYKYAIIVPNCNNDLGNYNGKTYLKNCIESILNQTYKDFKLIIVDDMSSDNSVETIKSYKDDRIVFIQNIRKRYNGGSRNVGIEYAINNLNFDYFIFLDSDDWWTDDKVLSKINYRLNNHELMTLGCKTVHINGGNCVMLNKADCYEDLWSFNNKVWCTAWARVIRKDKIKYFCEDTLMEDRVWTYKIADDINFENTTCLDEPVYIWNRMNTTNSVSLVRNNYWNACAYCHIGHQLQMLDNLKHKEMIPIIQERINICKLKIDTGLYQQY